MCTRHRLFGRRLSKLIGLTSLCLVFCGVSQALSYYVNCTTGSDSNPGTLSQPFKTLQKAQTAMRQSGTKTTTVESCTYSIAGGAWNFTSSDNGEIWVPLAGPSVTIDGGGSGYVSLSQVNSFTFEGFTLQNMVDGCPNNGCGVSFTGSILVAASRNCSFRWLTFADSCSGHCIMVRNSSSVLVDSNTITAQHPEEYSPPGSDAGHFSAIHFVFGGSNNTVSHNSIQNTRGGGIAFVHGPTDPLFTNVTIDRNLLQNVNTCSGDSTCQDWGSIYLYNGCNTATCAHQDTFTISYNNIFGNLGANYLTDSIKAFYLDQAISGATVKGNICNKCGEWAVQQDGGKSNTFTNNIFDLSQSGALLELYQNFNGTTNMSGNTWTNNIVWTSGSFPSQLRNEYGAPGNPPAVNTNDYWPTIPALCPSCSPAFTDTNSKSCDPGFVNPAVNNYTVTKTSCTNQIRWLALPTDQGPLPNPF